MLKKYDITFSYMTMSSKIDFDEPIPILIERPKSEHRSFDTKIVEIEGSINENDIAHATKIIRSMSDKVTRHAVKEEARLMRSLYKRQKMNLLNLSELCKNIIG